MLVQIYFRVYRANLHRVGEDNAVRLALRAVRNATKRMRSPS